MMGAILGCSVVGSTEILRFTLFFTMDQVIQCPGCKTRLKVDAAGGATTYKCPSCSQLLRVPTTPSSQAAPSLDTNATSVDLASVDVPAPTAAPVFSSPTTRAPSKKRRKQATQWSIQPFLNRWLIAMGAVCALAIVLGLAGIFSEVAGIFSAVVCMMAAIGCLFGGRFWIAIMLGREKAFEGILAVFIPLLGVVWALKRKGPLLKGVVVYVSALAPCLLGLLVIACFGLTAGGSGSRDRRASNNLAKVTNTIHEIEQSLPAGGSVTTVHYKLYTTRPGDLINFENGGNDALTEFKLYVPGSFQVDTTTRRVEIQHRGNDRLTMFYKLFLAFRFRVNLGIE
jgi:hypothetical protein